MSRENFDAIIKYYFIDNGIEEIGEKGLKETFERCKENIELFEFEYLIAKVIENISFFKGFFIGNLKIGNLCCFALDAFFDIKNVSDNRNTITKLFQEKLLA
jgi:hypothetical protein